MFVKIVRHLVVETDRDDEGFPELVELYECASARFQPVEQQPDSPVNAIGVIELTSSTGQGTLITLWSDEPKIDIYVMGDNGRTIDAWHLNYFNKSDAADDLTLDFSAAHPTIKAG